MNEVPITMWQIKQAAAEYLEAGLDVEIWCYDSSAGFNVYIAASEVTYTFGDRREAYEWFRSERLIKSVNGIFN